MADDPPTSSTPRQDAGNGTAAALLGAAAWGALAWLERRQRSRGTTPSTDAVRSVPEMPSAPSSFHPPASSPGPATTPSPSSGGGRVGTAEIAVVRQTTRDIPYRVPITAGGLTVSYTAGSLGTAHTWTAVSDDPGPTHGRTLAGPADSVEEIRTWLRAAGWTPVSGAQPERWERGTR
jgi:hypothetical protein